MKWNETRHNFLIQLINTHGRKWQVVADEMTKQFDEVYTSEQVRSRWRNNRHTVDEVDPVQKFGVKQKRNEDGTINLERLIEVYSENDLKDDAFVIKANGFDPEYWVLRDLEFSMWGHLNKELPKPVTLYANKIKLSPKVDEFNFEDLVNIIIDKTKPINISTVKHNIDDKRALGIYLMDLHFGVNTIDDYKVTLEEITKYLNDKIYEEIIITFGSDLLHVDSLANTTANQTRMQDVDMEQMIEDAKQFYVTLIDIAEKQSNKISIIYVKGNHDQSTSYLLAHWLDAHYKNVDKVKVDYKIQETKIHTFGKNFLAFSHGDKGARRRKNVLSARYPEEWAKSNVREIYSGHVHHEKGLDEFGIIERTLPTRAKTDQWHDDNSFVGAHKRFQIFEYSKDELKSIHYV